MWTKGFNVNTVIVSNTEIKQNKNVSVIKVAELVVQKASLIVVNPHTLNLFY